MKQKKSQLPSDCGNYPDDPNEKHYKAPLWHYIEYYFKWALVLLAVAIVIYRTIKAF